MANLEQWVSDRLHDILGLSDRYVAQFMIGLVRKSSSLPDFIGRLKQTGTIDVDNKVEMFAQELFNKVMLLFTRVVLTQCKPFTENLLESSRF